MKDLTDRIVQSGVAISLKNFMQPLFQTLQIVYEVWLLDKGLPLQPKTFTDLLTAISLLSNGEHYIQHNQCPGHFTVTLILQPDFWVLALQCSGVEFPEFKWFVEDNAKDRVWLYILYIQMICLLSKKPCTCIYVLFLCFCVKNG